MPRGTYLHLEDGTEERFQCAPGPGGWRYVASRTDGTRVDLVVDARWRQIRAEIVAPDWWLRGGVAGRETAWVRAGSSRDATEHTAQASGFLGESPAFAIVVARYLAEVRPPSSGMEGLPASGTEDGAGEHHALLDGAAVDVRLVRVSGAALATLTESWRWRLASVTRHEADTGSLPVEQYEVADLATGEVHHVHLAGDVVLDAPGIELVDLDGPPNFLTS
ncbi:hypothetical protein AB0L06_03435 [Spirillospora sp. NPDC052269]